MPHPRILKVLGMTPAQWGELPPETVDSQRNDLKRKAAALIAQEDKQNADNGINYRVAALESLVQTLSQQKDNSEVLNALAAANAKIASLESKVAALESKQTGG